MSFNPFDAFNKELKEDFRERKILFISDLHVPFHRAEYIERIVDEHSDAYLCVLGGDTYDGYGISRYRKKSHIPLLSEHVPACQVVDELANIYPWLMLIGGNHDARWQNQVISSMSQDIVPFLRHKSLLGAIVAGDRYDPEEEEWYNIGKMKNVLLPLDRTGEPMFYYQVGGTIFAHPEKGSKILGKPVQDAYLYFLKKGLKFDSIVMGHTHQAVEIKRPNILLVESGCMCHDLEYAENDSHLMYESQSVAYTIIYQDKFGKTDYERSKLCYLDP